MRKEEGERKGREEREGKERREKRRREGVQLIVNTTQMTELWLCHYVPSLAFGGCKFIKSHNYGGAKTLLHPPFLLPWKGRNER